MRRFIITMNQKGDLDFYKKRTEYGEGITFEKTENSHVQIACIDYDFIEKKYEARKQYELEHNGLVTCSNPLDQIEYYLGINKRSPYRFLHLLREIKPNDKDGYCSFEKKYITKETEKAYYVKELNLWIPKSQTILEDNMLYVKRWVIAKNC